MVLVEILLILLCNGIFLFGGRADSGRIYRVEAERIAREIDNQHMTVEEISAMDLSEYASIVAVSEFHPEESCENDYLVKEIGGTLYRMEYEIPENKEFLLVMNGVLLLMAAATATILIYVYRKVLSPFHAVCELPYELAKGNLSVPIKEEKSKIFGRYLWGMDMLREKLEDDRAQALALHKDRKTLLLSLSHDIKTPLASIEMYSKALRENLYDSREKQNDALNGIAKNTQEIQSYLAKIDMASREDFLHLEVALGECYLSEIIGEIRRYYQDKLSLLHTEFQVDDFQETLLRCDKDRFIEVIQNIMENAIKYGDGRRIRIYGEWEEDCQLIHIENSGGSLKESELPNLFDSFYRGSNSQGIKGSGLGLYICKTLMRKMDGDVFLRMKDGTFRASIVVRKV